MEDIQKKKKVTEYIGTIELFRGELNRNDQKNREKSWLVDYLNVLGKLATEIGETDILQRLDNYSGGYEEVEFFFPTIMENGDFHTERKLILMVTHELSRTGAPVVFLDAAKILKANGYDVLMISPMDGPLRKEICDAGIPVFIDHHLLLGRCEQAYLREAHQYQNWPVDILVSCADSVILNTACLHNAVERYMTYGKPIYWWLHEGNVSFEAFGDCLPEKLTENVKVLYVSEYVRTQMEASGIYYPGDVFHYGVEDFAKNHSASEKMAREDQVKFICVGAVCKRKGQDLLLDAIHRLPMEYLKKSQFYFVGGKADSDLYDRIDMLQNGCDFIHLCSSMKRDELMKFYEDIDFILCPSRDDPLPVVLTEMMILSKPCVISEHTGTATLMRDGEQGYIIRNDDVEHLVEVIMKCIEHPELGESMGKNARKIYEERLTMDVFQTNLLSIIKD